MKNEDVTSQATPVSVPDSSKSQPASSLPQQENVQEPQNIPASGTQSFNVESEPPKKKGLIFKKIIIAILVLVGLVIFLFLAGVLFSSRVLHKTPSIVLTSKNIPIGFKREKTVLSERDEAGRSYIFTYLHPIKGIFIYHLQYNLSNYTKCSPPQAESSLSSFLSNYRVFQPKKSEDGCAVTLTNKDGNKKGAYKWRTDSAQFYIYAENLCINDQEALNIANSLNPELIFVGKYINSDIPTRDF